MLNLERQGEMETIKKKKYRTAIECIEQGKDFNLILGNGRFVYMVGGILSKVEDGKHFVFIKDKGWVQT